MSLVPQAGSQRPVVPALITLPQPSLTVTGPIITLSKAWATCVNKLVTDTLSQLVITPSLSYVTSHCLKINRLLISVAIDLFLFLEEDYHLILGLDFH